MRRKHLLLLIPFLGVSALNTRAQNVSPVIENKISVIPQPLSVTQATGSFSIQSGTNILIDVKNPELKKNAATLSSHIKSLTGYSLPVKTSGKATTNSITLTLKNAPDSLGKEGYLLVSNPQGLTLSANTPQGIFYGMQTIYQLLPVNKVLAKGEMSIPAVTIADKPRYGWRGMMLDVGRHFYPVDFVKQFIDYLAMHKMNSFHWHLTEDQGWRIEIKKYPELTKTGA